MKFLKAEGITLVALVMTIIILLMLAGITLWLVVGDGMLGKAKNSVDLTNIASAKEQVLLKIKEYQAEYYDEVYAKGNSDVTQEAGDWIYTTYGEQKVETADYAFIISLPQARAVTEQNFYTVTIEKNNKLKLEITGILYKSGKLVWTDEIGDAGDNEENVPGSMTETSQLVTQAKLIVERIGATSVKLKIETLENEQEKIAGYHIFVNDKVERVSEQNEIEVNELQKNTAYKIFAQVIDEDGNTRKSNVENITTKNRMYLYELGNQYPELTGGWQIAQDWNTSTNLEDYDYIEMNSNNGNYCCTALSTTKKIDLTGYERLGANVTIISNGYTGGIDAGGYSLGISDTLINSLSSPISGFLYANGVSLEVGENKEITFDIKEYNNAYFIGFKNTRFLVKIHSIWLQ